MKQVSFTIKELRELLAIPSVSFLTDGPLLSRTLSSPPAQNLERPRKRLMQLLEKGTVEGLKDADKAWELDFFRSPREILVDSEGRVNGIALEVNEERTDGKAVGTGVVETVDCGLVFRSIGYRSVPVDGLPFDDRRGVVPNDKGRVTELPSIPEEIAKELGKDSPFNSFLPSPDPIPGLYVAGWLKRGPIGVIAQTMNDAHETAASIAADVEAGKLAGAKAGGDVLLQMLKDKGVRTVSYADWKRLEKWEEEQGKIRGKPREKVVDLDQALRIIDGLE